MKGLFLTRRTQRSLRKDLEHFPFVYFVSFVFSPFSMERNKHEAITHCHPWLRGFCQ
jgi:hypothetical protein